MPLDFTNLDLSVMEPARRSAGLLEYGRHFVQIYEDDASLVEAVATFLSLGISAGDAGIVIAHDDHIAAFEEHLVWAGVDLHEARVKGLLKTLNSHDLLARFMLNGMPDRSLFMESVGGLVLSAASVGNIRVFGEMVADLWAEGRMPAVMKLEELWNELASTCTLELFCAYPAGSFHDSELVALSQVCRMHSQVIPPTGQART